MTMLGAPWYLSFNSDCALGSSKVLKVISAKSLIATIAQMLRERTDQDQNRASSRNMILIGLFPLYFLSKSI